MIDIIMNLPFTLQVHTSKLKINFRKLSAQPKSFGEELLKNSFYFSDASTIFNLCVKGCG
jgi:hypothetical protein